MRSCWQRSIRDSRAAQPSHLDIHWILNPKLLLQLVFVRREHQRRHSKTDLTVSEWRHTERTDKLILSDSTAQLYYRTWLIAFETEPPLSGESREGSIGSFPRWTVRQSIAVIQDHLSISKAHGYPFTLLSRRCECLPHGRQVQSRRSWHRWRQDDDICTPEY